MKTENELLKSAMAFKLKNGDILLISKEDIQDIANKLLIEMIGSHQNKIIMCKSTSLERCNMLYKIVTEQKDKIEKDTMQSYFKTMLQLIQDDEKEFITLEEEIKKSQENKKQ